MRHSFRLSALIVPIAVAACVPAPKPPPAPRRPVAAAPLPPAPRPLASDWRDWPRTPGDWHYARTADGSAASYRNAGAALFTLQCARGPRQVTLSRTDGATESAGLTVRTTSTVRAIATRPTPAGGVGATLAASDPLLDAMAFSRGRFTVEQPGAPPLVMPAWAEVGRVIEDCRG